MRAWRWILIGATSGALLLATLAVGVWVFVEARATIALPVVVALLLVFFLTTAFAFGRARRIASITPDAITGREEA